MAIRMSSALKAEWLGGSSSLREILNFGIIDLYTGQQPASADLAPTGTHIGRVTAAGATFNPGSPTGGLTMVYVPLIGELMKNPSQTWTITPLESGTVGWWRFKGNAPDSNTESTQFVRLDGEAGSPYNELYLFDLGLVVGQLKELELFQLNFIKE